MGRSPSPSPLLKREFENLGKDANSRRMAMKSLRSYVKDLDSKSVPLFLDHVSNIQQTHISTDEYMIPLYEVLARGQGPRIIPQIDNIMTTMIKTLSSSEGSFALQQACSRVVSAIVRYSIDPTTAEDKRRFVIRSVYQPLSDCLLVSQENLSSGAALCLHALVESDNWRFASNELVNEVCQRVAGALEKHSQTNSHLALVMALAKQNSLIVEAYTRLFFKSGLQILKVGLADQNSQKQLSAIRMMSSLMRSLDQRSVLLEIELVIKELEKCQSDCLLPYVTRAAFEALQTAKRIYSEKDSKYYRVIGSTTRSKFNGRENVRRIVCSSGEPSPFTASPESRTVDSFCGHDYFVESPVSTHQNHQGMHCDGRNVNRKLWQRWENGGVDVSLKDGILSGVSQRDANSSEYDEFSDIREYHAENFSAFLRGNSGYAVVSSTTPSPPRSNSRINLHDKKISAMSRELIQNRDDSQRAGWFRTSTPTTPPEWSPKANGILPSTNHDISSHGEALQSDSEWVSSTEGLVADTDLQVSPQIALAPENNMRKDDHTCVSFKIFWWVLVVIAACFRMSGIGGDGNDGHSIIPT